MFRERFFFIFPAALGRVTTLLLDCLEHSCFFFRFEIWSATRLRVTLRQQQLKSSPVLSEIR